MTVLQKAGPDNDVVLSVRVRIARNFADIPFPTSMNLEDSAKVKERVLNIVKELEEFKFKYCDFASISAIERLTFVERHLCSKELAKAYQMSGLLVSQDESVSIMINEEDHIRVQILSAGLDYESAIQKQKKIQKVFDSSEYIAYKEELGYLTSCPTNLGEGIRASAMIRIPAISISGDIKGMMTILKKAGFILRGIYGEGSSSIGGIMQLSNASSIAQSTDEIIEKVKKICKQIIIAEREKRKALIDKDNIRLQDKVLRGYGIMLYAKRITQKELGLLVGDIWLGKDLGLIDGLNHCDLLYLLTSAQDATLQILTKEEKNKTLLNIKRAQYIQNYLKLKRCI